METLSSSTKPADTLALEEKRALVAKLLQSARAKPQLSVTQERIWQLDQLQPGNPIYNFQSAIELNGPLDHAALEAALGKLVQRQETLRTRYGVDKGQPQIQILDRLDTPLSVDDWREIAPDEQQRRLQERARADAQTGFPLNVAPLFRLRLIRFGDERHVLVLTMHHIVSDLLSLEIFFHELGVLYSAERGAGSVLDPLTATYQDFARYQRKHHPALTDSPAAQYWRAQLGGAPALEWLSDFPRPDRPSYKAATVFFDIGPELLSKVDALARAERATPFMVLLSAFYVLVHAATRQEDLIVGSPTAGRLRAEYESLIGMFSYPLALRTRVESGATFGDLLRAVRQNVLSATEHVDLSFAQVVDLAQQAGATRGPLVRPMFSYVSRLQSLEFAELEIKRVATDRGMSDFDLFLTVYQDAGRLHGVFEYNTDLFSRATAAAWARAYTEIVHRAADAPASPVAGFTAAIPVQEPFRILLAASFTADTLDDVVRYWSRELRYPIQLELAPYNQIFQELLDPNSRFHTSRCQVSVMLLRPEDWVRYQQDAAERERGLTQSVEDFIDAVKREARRLYAPLYVYLCSSTPTLPERDRVLALETRLIDELSGLPDVEIARAETLMARYAVAHIHDPQADKIGHVPFTHDWFVAFGTALTRRLSRQFRTPYKVVALDCDGTLWRGVCGEDGPTGVKIDAPFRALQQFMRALADSGMLLCLVSKNQEHDVAAVFAQHPDMLLRPEHVTAQRVNWEPKSRNLRALAAELNLGLDSFIFIDDNPVECAEVRAECPEVLTLQLPADSERIPSFLEHVWAFDRGAASDEDRKRAKSYRENREREGLKREAGSFAEFLRGLELVVDVAPSTPDQQPRVAQLSQRTNQFNASGLRLNEAALRQALSDGLQVLAVHVKDRFGDYGLVGAIFHWMASGYCRVEGFLLSCRVLGRGVEHRMLQTLGEAAHATGATDIDIVYREQPRNQPVLQFLQTLPGAFQDEAGGRVFRIGVESARHLQFDPMVVGTEQILDHSDRPPCIDVGGALAERQLALAGIAQELRELGAIRARLESHGRRRRKAATQTAPQSEMEQTIAEIFRAALRLDAIGRDDNFFDAGGTSLMLVQVNAQLIEKFGRDIPITDLFQYPTVASLAAYLGAGTAEVGAKLTQSQARADQARQNMQRRLRQWGAMRRADGSDGDR